MRRNRRPQFAGRRSTTPRPCHRRSRRRVKACAPRPQAQPARWPPCWRARLGRTFAWLNSRPIFTALPINASFRHHLGISGVGAKLAGAFSGPRLILDHPGQQTMQACDEVLCGRDQTVGQGDCRGTHQERARRPAGAITHGRRWSRNAAARKPDGIDFVGNSKISSFCLKSAPDSPISYIWYYYTSSPPSACSLPARRVKLTDGALAPRQRGACRGDSNASSSQPSRAFRPDQQRFRAR
jgi:hypothetical protein